MEATSNDTFCSLDMLAEVASATLQNDLSLVSNSSPEEPKNIRIANSPLTRKSVNTSEKLTLEQIKCLSERNLIDMFSEHICDEMKKMYSFQCYLMPEKCTQMFQSFGNEARARCKMKGHLLNHIRDISATANASNDQEVFMAEPLHVRRKRLTEVNRKNVRKKKQSKPVHNKYRRDTSYEYFYNEDSKNFTNQSPTNTVKHAALNPASHIDFDSWTSGFCINENFGDHYGLMPYHNDKYDRTQVILKGHSFANDLKFSKSYVRKTQRAKRRADLRRKFAGAFFSHTHPGSDYDDKYHANCVQSESEPCLPIHHDHSYTSVNGKTFNDPSSSGESNKPSKIIYRDPFHPKRTAHRCLTGESLIIPTPPFPYVYNPVLPHIALIQEVGYNFRTTGCKCRNNILDGLWGCSKPKSILHQSPKDNECLKNSVNRTIPKDITLVPVVETDASSATFVKEIISKNGLDVASTIKLPGSSSSSYIDLLQPTSPEDVHVVEKV